MTMESTYFGTTKKGEKVEEIIIINDNHVSIAVTTFGAILTSVRTPDSDGHISTISLGFNELMDYEEDHPYLGATVGRVANRIARGQFSLAQKKYKLAINNGLNHLHGGLKGFDKQVWKYTKKKNADFCSVTMSHTSPDGDEGYPGNLDVIVKFTLNNRNELIIDYFAKTDQKTIVNLTNHSYWNLKGAGRGTIRDHSIYINANHYLPVDDTSIPTGELASVHDTPFFFLNERRINDDIDCIGGYDHCFALNHPNVKKREMLHGCTVFERSSGRRMEIFTDQPGVQFYTGNFLEGVQTKNGEVNKQEAFALETQNFPDSINQKGFPSAVLNPGKEYKTQTIYKFSVEPKVF